MRRLDKKRLSAERIRCILDCVKDDIDWNIWNGADEIPNRFIFTENEKPGINIGTGLKPRLEKGFKKLKMGNVKVDCCENGLRIRIFINIEIDGDYVKKIEKRKEELDKKEQ